MILFLSVKAAHEIFIKTMTGKSVSIPVTSSDLVADIKARLGDKENIDVSQQRLLYGGRELKDDKSLSHYNIQADSVVNLVMVQHQGKWC